MSYVEEFRRRARRRLPRFLFDYLDGGAGAEHTLGANARDLAGMSIRQRVLRDVSAVETSTTLFGQAHAMPLVLAPVGMAGMYARRGEAQAAAAAHMAGVPFTLSTVSICDLREVRQASGATPWFQLYITRDRGFMRDVIARAAALGAPALMLTVDMPVPGLRHRDARTGLSAAPGLLRNARLMAQVAAHPDWAWDVGVRGRPAVFGTVAASAEGDFGVDRFWSWMSRSFDASVTLKDLETVRSLWSGPLIVKGVMDPEDARAVIAAGADGLVVSNHGGRQLDGAGSSIRALPRIRDVVGEDVTLLMDGGIRSGADILRAVASGADAAMIGRPWVYALAADGRRGVTNLLGLLQKELAVTMALAGATRLSDIDRTIFEA